MRVKNSEFWNEILPVECRIEMPKGFQEILATRVREVLKGPNLVPRCFFSKNPEIIIISTW